MEYIVVYIVLLDNLGCNSLILETFARQTKVFLVLRRSCGSSTLENQSENSKMDTHTVLSLWICQDFVRNLRRYIGTQLFELYIYICICHLHLTINMFSSGGFQLQPTRYLVTWCKHPVVFAISMRGLGEVSRNARKKKSCV